MNMLYRQIEVERQGDVWCIALRNSRLEEDELQELGRELASLCESEKPKIVLTLGPEQPQCLYSVFLAKLVHLHQRVRASGGEVVLANMSPDVFDIFKACGMDKIFRFAPDVETAVRELSGADNVS